MKEQKTNLPQIGKLLESPEFENLNKDSVKKIARVVVEEARKSENSAFDTTTKIVEEILKRYKILQAPSIKPLINATGVVVHTNLGRSAISKKSLNNIFKIASGYSNLEFDIESGKRGDRYGHLTKLARFLFGCEDILLVNNNAAAVFLILNTFANKKECVVSRGELVEIGGGFRVPDVMSRSGAKLIEIGTTNKTRIADYENAISSKTAILMKVHRSNFAISGFTQEAPYNDVIDLAKNSGVIDYYDLGSASLVDYKAKWSKNEPNLFELLALNPSLLSFSADKLFGSIQAGIIVGKKELIDKLKKNQLLRMLRCDKISIALVEQTLLEYAFGSADQIPTVRMLLADTKELMQKAEQIVKKSKKEEKLQIKNTKTFVGGGALPQESVESVAIFIKSSKKPEQVVKILRKQFVIARIEDEMACLDMRSLTEDDCDALGAILSELDL